MSESNIPTPSEALVQYGDALRRLDLLQRDGGDGDDALMDEMDLAWRYMNADGRVEANRLSVALHQEWTPQQKLRDAIAVIESFPQPGPNDVTPEVTRARQLSFWKCRMDEVRANIAEAELAEARAIIAKHNLCHDLHGKVGRAEFEEGCRLETIKEFGSCGWHARIKKLEDELAEADRPWLGEELTVEQYRRVIRRRDAQLSKGAGLYAKMKAEAEHLTACITALETELAGHVKAAALMNAGFESTCERYDELKHANRKLLAERDAALDALETTTNQAEHYDGVGPNQVQSNRQLLAARNTKET